MIHPDTELRLINPEIGYGVCVTKFIPRGTITWTTDPLDQVFEPEQFAALPPFYQNIVEEYCYNTAAGNYVLCWDLGRYVNHSCDPTVRGVGYHFSIAVRDIHPGEQLTNDYGTLNISKSFSCCCGTPQCRSTIYPDDILRYWQEWDAALVDAFFLIPSVPQPLWTIAIEENLENKAIVEGVLNGRMKLSSCLEHYSQPITHQFQK